MTAQIKDMKEENYALLPSLLQGILCLLFLWPVLRAIQQDSNTKQNVNFL